jgi:hypothetical protein
VKDLCHNSFLRGGFHKFIQLLLDETNFGVSFVAFGQLITGCLASETGRLEPYFMDTRRQMELAPVGASSKLQRFAAERSFIGRLTCYFHPFLSSAGVREPTGPAARART